MPLPNLTGLASFGLFTVILGAIVVIALIIFALRRVVPTNMVHIVQTSKSTVSYGKGRDAGNVYYEIPSWVPVFGLSVTHYQESVFTIKLKDYEGFDLGRVPFLVDVTGFFRISDSDKAAHRVTNFLDLQGQLMDVMQSVVRSALGSVLLEDIMVDRTKMATEFTETINAQLAEYGCTSVRDVAFMDIRDVPGGTVILNIMAKERSRIEMESRKKVAQNHQEAEMAEITANQLVSMQEQVAQETVGIRTAEQKKAVGIAEQESQQEILVSRKVTTEREMEVKSVQDVRTAEIEKNVASVIAEQNKQVAEIRAEQDRNVTVVNAEATKQSVTIEAEATKAQMTLVAEGQLATASNEAQGVQLKGAASAEAQRLLLLAPVSTQIELAKEIGENAPYQQYLVTLEQIKASQSVGVELAKAIAQADLKVIANSGDIQGGVASLGDLFTARGGTTLTGLLAALSQTPQGKALVDRLTGENSSETPPPSSTAPGRTANGRPA